VSYQTEGCKECEKGEPKRPADAITTFQVLTAILLLFTCCWVVSLIVGVALKGQSFLNTEHTVATLGLCVFSLMLYIISMILEKNIFEHVFKQHGSWHTHYEVPIREGDDYIFMGENKGREDMIIHGPIFKLQICGWGKMRHSTLQGNFNGWEITKYYIGGDGNPYIDLKRGLQTRQEMVWMEAAYNIVGNTCDPIHCLADHDSSLIFAYQQLALQKEITDEVITDVIELIRLWKNSERSNVGMGSRVMLEEMMKALRKDHVESQKTELLDESTQMLLGSVRAVLQRNIAAITEKSEKVRAFVGSKPQYLPKPQETPAEANG